MLANRDIQIVMQNAQSNTVCRKLCYFTLTDNKCFYDVFKCFVFHVLDVS